MRIILSRKGFDSSAGGVASPIFPSGELCSLPIPESSDNLARGRPYGTIHNAGISLGSVVADLTGGQLGPGDRAHLDPDLDRESVPRPPGWKPTFGQTAAAESHLRNQRVGPGDLFLFFGWFREVEESTNRFRYRPDSPDRHLLFGWLQVAQRLPAATGGALPGWVRDHPHAVAAYCNNDSLYVAAESLQLGGCGLDLPGGGIFRRYHPQLCLTARGASRSKWSLPLWIHPGARESALSYHGRPDRWSRTGDRTLLQTVGRGQEFVLNCEHYPEALAWVRELLLTCAG